MRQEELEAIKQWFGAYSGSFTSEEPSVRNAFALKRAHTAEVARNIVLIARGEGMDEDTVRRAEAVGILHDTGRFPQFEKHRTFRDAHSVNHGELGCRVIGEQGVLAPLGPPEREMVMAAVKYHNAYAVPDLPDADTVTMIKLIRDADKLDVWRVLAEFYESREGERDPAIGIGLPETPGWRASSVESLRAGRMITLGAVDNLNDLRLLHISWVHDLNYRTARMLLKERRLLERIAATLPPDPSLGGLVKETIERLSSGPRAHMVD